MSKKGNSSQLICAIDTHVSREVAENCKGTKYSHYIMYEFTT